MIQLSLSTTRKNSGISFEEVANIVGVDQQTLAKYETDSTKIPFKLLNSLSKLYQTPKDYIFLGKQEDSSER